MNTSNSNRLAFMILGLVVLTTASANAQQLRFAPPQQSSQYANLGIQTTLQTYKSGGYSHNGTATTFGERIDYVRHGSPAAQTGLEAGDIIVGYYMGHSYRKFNRPADLKFAIVSSRGYLKVKVINCRNGQFVDATIRFRPGQGGNGNGNGGNGNGGNGNGGNGNGNGAGGLEIHDHRTVHYPTMPPPAPKFQSPTARAGYVWIPGNYKWRKENGGAYVWHGGHWEGAKANNATFTPGYWSKQGNRWVWTAGRWSKGQKIIGVRRR